jgi:hypothetical protein
MIKILFLSANPKGASALRLSEEVRAIQERLLTSESRQSFKLESTWALRISDIQEALLRNNPNIVHFTGHGGSNRGLVVEDNSRQSNVIPNQVLSSLFTIFKDEVRCVVLNGCINKEQALAILNVIGCVVCIPAGLSDKNAISFCASFYRALAFGRNIREAFELGRNTLQLDDADEGHSPHLLISPEINIASTYLEKNVRITESTSFSSLDFGAPAAERDIAKGLKDYFVESEAFRRVYSGGKFIVLGNRGAGKSAIFKVIAERERQNGTLIIELTPEDYSYEMLSSVMLGEKAGSWAKHGAYAAAWKYLIYVLIMKLLTEQSANFKKGPEAKIYAYLRDNHKGFQGNPIAVLISYLKRMEGLKIGPYEASIKSKELIKLYRLEEINELLPALTEMCQKQKLLVLVDELDRGWDASEDAKAFVAGLFQAVISINELTPNLRVIVSLRMELYDSIPALYEDAQKYRDVMEIISWDEASLLQLVAKRIRHTVQGLTDNNDIECWNNVFAETLDYRQTKSFNYLVDRTLYRPREIIQFCTDALQESRKAQSWPIDYPVITKAELLYSEERTKDIVAEYRFQFPGLMSIFDVFRGKSYSLNRDDLELICLGINTGEFGVEKNAKWVNEQEVEYLIEILWRIGFLRAQAVGGIKALRRSGSSYLGPHQVSNLNLRNVPRFQVHPMFRSFLGMKEARDISHDNT